VLLLVLIDTHALAHRCRNEEPFLGSDGGSGSSVWQAGT
jgi:hypothetical protein